MFHGDAVEVCVFLGISALILTCVFTLQFNNYLFFVGGVVLFLSLIILAFIIQ